MACERTIDAPGFEPGRDWRTEAALEATRFAGLMARRWRVGAAGAADIGQDAAVACLTGTVRFAGSAKAYGRRAAWVAFNATYREDSRRRRVAARVGDAFTAELAHAAPPAPADELLAAHERLAAVQALVARLSPARRAAVEAELAERGAGSRAARSRRTHRSNLRDGLAAVRAGAAWLGLEGR